MAATVNPATSSESTIRSTSHERRSSNSRREQPSAWPLRVGWLRPRREAWAYVRDGATRRRISRATRWMIGAHNRDEHRRKRHVPVSAPGTVAEVSVGETSRRSAIARVERRYPALDSRAYERARSRSRQPWWRRIRLIVGKVVAGVPTVPALRTSPPLTLGRLVTPDTAHAFVVARERYREGHRKCI